MAKTPRLSIELKSQEELDLRHRAYSKAVANKSSLREIVIDALEAYCSKK